MCDPRRGNVTCIQSKANWFGVFHDFGVGIGGVDDAATYTELGKLSPDVERAQAVGNAGAALLSKITNRLKTAAKG